MDANTHKILAEEFEAIRVDLIKKYDELGMRASGNFERSLEVEVYETGAKIKGADYAEQLQFGRGPNSGRTGKKWDKPSEDIEQWLIDKGVAAYVTSQIKNSKGEVVNRQISRSSLAFAIVKKIAKHGYKREAHGGVELVSQVITQERIQKILNRVSDIYAVEFTTMLIEYLRKQV